MMIVAVLALLTGRGLSKPAIVCPADAGNTHALAAAEVQRSIYQRSDTLLPIARQLPFVIGVLGTSMFASKERVDKNEVSVAQRAATAEPGGAVSLDTGF